MAGDPLRVAVIGVGRIGIFHARHVQEVGDETGACRLVAVADRHEDTAQRAAERLSAGGREPVAAFDSAEALAEAGAADAAVIASRTRDHRRDAEAMVKGGGRVLLEKPLADSLEEARDLAAWLDADDTRRRAVMLAFQRRYDEALLRARELLRDNAIGRLFKTVSVLEDPEPPPPGYQSPGLLADMAVHNADEILWLGGGTPTEITGVGARLHNQRIPGVVEEDFDDVFGQMWFGDEATAQIQVSRNHVAGYRNETFLYGAGGLIHVGHFDEDPLRARVEAFGRDHEIIEQRAFELRDYGEPVPVFIRRFGNAYKAEVADFVAKCRGGEPFAVTHRDGLRAMEVVIAGAGAVRGRGEAAPILLSH